MHAGYRQVTGSMTGRNIRGFPFRTREATVFTHIKQKRLSAGDSLHLSEYLSRAGERVDGRLKKWNPQVTVHEP
jgi:hypothetical protein